MPDPIAILWSSFDLSEPMFSPSEVAAWPHAEFAALKAASVIRTASTATHVVCPACDDGHVEEVQRVGSDARERLFLICPTAGRVRLTHAEIEQWMIGFDRVAEMLSTALNGSTTPIVPGRLWRLGKSKLGDVAREVLLARGLGWADQTAIVDKVPRGGPPIILVASPAPPRDVWRGVRPAVINLTRVVDWSGGSFVIDALLLKTLVDEEDAASRRLTGLELDREALAGIVRREAAKQAKTELREEAMVDAYVRHGSTRRAAAALKEQGHPVDHSTVSRAVTKFGGPAEVRRMADLASVEKPVALQRRNRAKKS